MVGVLETHYAALAAILRSAAGTSWDQLEFTTQIFQKDCSSMETTRISAKERDSIGLGFKYGFQANDVVLAIRDHLLQTTGHRIFGLTFTLFPDMKCRIEYDYNPPEGYEETDDTLTLEDAVDRLQKMGIEVEVTDKKS